MSTGRNVPGKSALHLGYWNWEWSIKTQASWNDAQKYFQEELSNSSQKCAQMYANDQDMEVAKEERMC